MGQATLQSVFLFLQLAILSDTDEEDWILIVLDNLMDWSLMLAMCWAYRPPSNFRLFEVSFLVFMQTVKCFLREL